MVIGKYILKQIYIDLHAKKSTKKLLILIVRVDKTQTACAEINYKLTLDHRFSHSP